MVEAQVNRLLVCAGTVLGRELLLVDVDVDFGRLIGGRRVVLPENDVRVDDVVEKLINKSAAVKIDNDNEDSISIDDNNGGGNNSNGPVWSRKYWVGENANISLNVWDRGDFLGAELTRDVKEDGEWDKQGKVYLPSSKTLLEMAEDMKNLYFDLKNMKD